MIKTLDIKSKKCEIHYLAHLGPQKQDCLRMREQTTKPISVPNGSHLCYAKVSRAYRYFLFTIPKLYIIIEQSVYKVTFLLEL